MAQGVFVTNKTPTAIPHPSFSLFYYIWLGNFTSAPFTNSIVFIPYRKEKTLLLFVIRDHVGATPLANLSNTLKADLERIWHGLSKVQ